jgi:Bacterial Ig domain/Secretion system C-terminal sorting domain
MMNKPTMKIKIVQFFMLALLATQALKAQITTLPYSEPFAANLNGWVSRTPGGNNFTWQATVGIGGTGGVRTKLPTDSNFLSSPPILLTAGKMYTFTFHARQDISDQNRRIVVSYNTTRTRIGATQFYEKILPGSSYTTPPYVDYNPSFSVPTTGYYYIIYWLANSGGSTGYLFTYLDNVSLEETVPPTINLTSPIDGGSMNENYADSTKVILQATAADADGTVDSVVFFRNNVRLGADLAAPYEWKLLDVEPGQYQFKAVAYDNKDNSTTSNVVNYTVNFRDGTLSPYVQWDFETNGNSQQTTGVFNWVFKDNLDPNGAWKTTGGGFHNSACVESWNPVAGSVPYAATPGVQLTSGSNYKLEFVGDANSTNRIYRLLLATSQNIADTVQFIDTVRLNTTDDFNRIISKNFTLPTSGNYHLIIRSMTAGAYLKIKFDNIRIIGNGLNLAPVSNLTAPAAALVAAQNSSLFLQANAFDEGTIQKVEFYANNVKIGEDFTPPYNTTWAGLPVGSYSVYAKPFDNNGAFSQSAPITITVQANQFKQSSFLGSTDVDDIRATFVKTNNDLVIVGNFGSSLPTGTAPKYYIDGATDNSKGAILILSSDGKALKSVTRVAAEISDAAKDRNDNFYIAAAGAGAYKLNSLGTAQIWKRTFAKTVNRIDVGVKTAVPVVLISNTTDINEDAFSGAELHILTVDGTQNTHLGGVTSSTSDITIDEASQTVIGVGYKNFNTPSTPGAMSLPVYVPVMKAFSYTGVEKYIAYDWSQDQNSPRWLNRPENNMADMRFNRCTIGKDGLLYVAGQVYGGNHCMRYDPFDIMLPAAMTGGDTYFNLANTGTETHIYLGRFNPATGNVLKQQSLTARLPNTAGNSMFIEHGCIDADAEGNVYIAGASASGMPQTVDYLPGQYTGGGLIMVLNNQLNVRKLSVRLGTNITNSSICPINENQFIVAGNATLNGENQSPLYTTSTALQPNYGGGSKDGYFAVINNNSCAYPETLHGVATTNANTSHVAVAYEFFTADCKAIATLNPSGAQPIADTMKARVWIDATQTAMHVKRHYEITPYDDNNQPLANAADKTGTVTLYFTQQEFDDFNAVSLTKLPNGPTDNAAKANVRVIKKPGISSNGTGSLNSYTGTSVFIDPADNNIVWNATENRWEITFDVNGFSGFFVTVLDAVLPVRWVNVEANLTSNKKANVTWVVVEQDIAAYEVEKSMDGVNFKTIGTVASKGNGNNTYTFVEQLPLNGMAYYRVKQIEVSGKNSHSKALMLNNMLAGEVSVFPNPVVNAAWITVPSSLVNTTAQVFDAKGQIVKQLVITAKQISLDVAQMPTGMYLIKFSNGDTKRIIKQ